MATNLVSLVMQFLTPDMIAKIASAVGLDRAIAQKAIEGAVPALLSSLAGVASTPGGAGQLSRAVAQQPASLDNIRNLIGGSGQKAFTDSGSAMLSGLLGGGTMDALKQAISRYAGIGEGASKSLLGMLGPIALGALGQQQSVSGMGPSGLASMLTAQKDQFAAAIPRGLADELRGAGLTNLVDGGLRRGAAAASGAASGFDEAADRTMPGIHQASQASTSALSSQWPYWLAAIVLLGGLGWYVMADRSRDRVAEAPTATPPAGQTSGTVGFAPSAPDLTVGGVNLVNQVNASIGTLRPALGSITDANSAHAALPKIQEATAQLNEVGTLSTRLSAENKSALAKLVAAAMPTINPLCEKVLEMPGVGSIAKPAIDDLRGKLDTLTRA